MNYHFGDVYEGDFVEGLREGIGKYTNSRGDVVQGRWRKDILIQEGINWINELHITKLI